MENNKLGIIEYQEVVIDNISTLILNKDYIEENKDFFDNVLYKMYEIYINDVNDSISIRKQAQFLEIFLGMNFKFKLSDY